MHTWVEISKGALAHNLRQFKFISKDAKLIGVIKANAYGHGLEQVADAIADTVDYLAVINLNEAKRIRAAGVRVPVLILGYVEENKEELQWLIRERVELVVNSLTHAQRLSKLLFESGEASELRVHAKVDTGMGRMGIMPEHAVGYIKQINELPHLYLKGVESHFADVTNHPEYTKKQLAIFLDIKYQLYREKIEPPLFHIAKTEAILNFFESHLDAVRLGIGLYGLWPDTKLIDRVALVHPEFSLKPVLSWKARVLQVKDYPEGSFIGYGCTHQTKRKTRIAIIPVGYYEGYSRGLSNKGEMLIRGKRCKVLGNICMNMAMVDVTAVSGVQRADEAVLIGAQKHEEITAHDIAEILGTVHYEVVTRINPLIPRVVVA
ncbi:alanine racemase [bacterium CG10_46_32]|nr:MAG: alanine racemase [bacterium CG10_46_32]PIR55965.1 MAG: alanine racemase [Parcubacteria group bacterium CG10_big_fil_rev_8_21_14_0_10_46_32]